MLKHIKLGIWNERGTFKLIFPIKNIRGQMENKWHMYFQLDNSIGTSLQIFILKFWNPRREPSRASPRILSVYIYTNVFFTTSRSHNRWKPNSVLGSVLTQMLQFFDDLFSVFSLLFIYLEFTACDGVKYTLSDSLWKACWSEASKQLMFLFELLFFFFEF